MSTVWRPRLILSLAAGLIVGAYVLSGIRSVGARPFSRAGQIFTVNTEDDIAVVGGCQTNPTCSLRDAINAANTQVGPDDIVLPSGTYLLSSRLPSITSVLTLTGFLSSTTIIDGNNAYRVLQIDSEGQMVLCGVTVQHGKAVADPGGGAITNLGLMVLQDSLIRDNTGISEGSTFNNGGGGILNWMGTLSVIDSELSGNVSVSNSSHNGSNGGAIYNQLGAVTILDSSIHGNSALYSGAIHNNGGVITVTNSLIFDNAATSGSGGGIFNSCGTLMIANSTLQNNTAANQGGGIHLNCGEAVVSKSRIEGNAVSSTSGSGGGIYSGGTLVVEDSVIAENNAPLEGGGVDLNQSNAILVNNQITDNQTAGQGSGLYIGDSSFQLLHSTIARNSGGDGSGVYVEGSGCGPGNPTPSPSPLPIPGPCEATMTLSNTILVSQTVGIYTTSSLTITMVGTLWGAGAWANQADWAGPGTILTGTVNVWDSPDFVNPDAGDYHLGPASSAIDRGVNAGVFTDIDGDVRPQGGGFDIGADEYRNDISLPTIYLPLVLRQYP